jgi:hypothetical protein
MTNPVRDPSILLNVASIVMDRDRFYALLKKALPMYWYTRPSTRFMIRYFRGQSLIGAEVGVDYGLNARTMLRLLPLQRLYLIDPYSEVCDSVSGEQRFRAARRYLGKYHDVTMFIRKKSESAAGDLPNGLDFVYVDGCHEYDCVMKDLNIYYPKIRSGGVLAGHDFWASNLGVCQAVLEFCHTNALVLEGSLTDWWVHKP